MLGLLKRAGDAAFALRLLRLLTMPIKKTDAFKLGIIDADGEKLKSPETPHEKAAYTLFHRLAFNLRRIIRKVPIIGKSLITNYAVALYLIKEETGVDDMTLLCTICEAQKVDIDTVLEELQVLSESTETELNQGIYTLNEDTKVMVYNTKPVGHFMQIPIFEGKTKEDTTKLFTL